MLHFSSRNRSGSSGSRHAPIIVALRPASDADLEVVASEVGSPRDVLWSPSLRLLAGELQLAQDALDADADGGAWVVPL